MWQKLSVCAPCKHCTSQSQNPSSRRQVQRLKHSAYASASSNLVFCISSYKFLEILALQVQMSSPFFRLQTLLLLRYQRRQSVSCPCTKNRVICTDGGMAILLKIVDTACSTKNRQDRDEFAKNFRRVRSRNFTAKRISGSSSWYHAARQLKRKPFSCNLQHRYSVSRHPFPMTLMKPTYLTLSVDANAHILSPIAPVLVVLLHVSWII